MGDQPKNTDLLNNIQAGAKLKKVDTKEKQVLPTKEDIAAEKK